MFVKRVETEGRAYSTRTTFYGETWFFISPSFWRESDRGLYGDSPRRTPNSAEKHKEGDLLGYPAVFFITVLKSSACFQTKLFKNLSWSTSKREGVLFL